MRYTKHTRPTNTNTARKTRRARPAHLTRGNISTQYKHNKDKRGQAPDKPQTNTKKQKYTTHKHDTEKQYTPTTYPQTKTPPKQPSQKRRAQKIDSARRQRLGAQSLKKAGGAKTGGQIRLAYKGGARDPIAPKSHQIYIKAATICPRNLFLFNTYKKYKILFILAYI